MPRLYTPDARETWRKRRRSPCRRRNRARRSAAGAAQAPSPPTPEKKVSEADRALARRAREKRKRDEADPGGIAVVDLVNFTEVAMVELSGIDRHRRSIGKDIEGGVAAGAGGRYPSELWGRILL